MKAVYHTHGTCSQAIELEVNDLDHTVQSVNFVGGCSGNTQGISMLVRGQKAEDVINRLQGIRCGMKNTSCPDQLAIALAEAVRRIERNKETNE